MYFTVSDALALRPGGLSDTQKQDCGIEPCWTLYETSQDYYQVQMDYEHIAHPQDDPEKWQGHCITQRTFYLCLKAIYRNKSLDCHGDLGYRSAYYGIEKRMQEMNCSFDGQTFDPSMVTTDHSQVCTYDGPPVLRYCSLFGDPHLLTFSDKFQTCQIQGAWPLLDNRYLTVQVTSKAVNNLYGPATAITEVGTHITNALDRNWQILSVIL
jgi:RGM family protein